jgi:hypothetical protein
MSPKRQIKKQNKLKKVIYFLYLVHLVRKKRFKHFRISGSANVAKRGSLPIQGDKVKTIQKYLDQYI